MIRGGKEFCEHRSQKQKELWNDQAYRAKMLLAHKKRIKNDPETGKRQSERLNKLWATEEYRNKQTRSHSKGSKERWQDPVFREKVLDARLASYREGKSRPTLGKGERVLTEKAGEIICSTVWEVLFANILDTSAAVKYFKKDYLRIPYQWEYKTHTYFPDFYVKMKTGEVLVIELKATLHKFGRWDYVKLAAAKQYCKKKGWEFMVLAVSDIDELKTASEAIQ